MSENINEKEGASRSGSAQEVSTDGVEEEVKGLRIYPRKILGSLPHLRIDRARIKPIESYASKAGGTADVEVAILDSGQPSSASEPEVTEYVAVKKLRFDTEVDQNRALGPFAYEVGLLNGLSHDNVVKILGFVEDVNNGVVWMVFRWENNGNLREFVRSENWELPERISLINDVAKGLSYLHGRNPPICHGDLKSLNILVNSENRAIITDFGSARTVDSTIKDVHVHNATKRQHRPSAGPPTAEPLKAEIAASGEFITMTGPAWTIRWAAPELLKGDLPGLGSDVWAFGWICWEAVTGNFPFEEENNIEVIRRIVARDLPNINNNAQFDQMKMLCSLMEECLRLDANKRPPAMRCQQELSFMDRAAPSGGGRNGSVTTRSSGLLGALGWIQLRNGVMPEAQEYFRQSLEASKSVGDEQGEARATWAIGEAYRIRNEYSKAEESYIQSRDLYSRIGDQLGFAQSFKALGDVYRMRNEYSKAEELYIQTRDLYSGMEDQLGLAQSIKALGDVYRMQNEYSKAEESYIQSRDLYSGIGDQLGFAELVWALGDVYRMRHEYSKAEESYIQCRDLYSRIGHQLGFGKSVNALGEVYRMRNEYSKAEESYIQSRDLYSRIGNQLGFAQSVWALGEVYRMRKEYSKAEESYIQSRDLYSRIGNQLGLAQSVKALGDVYRTRREYSKAEESYIQSHDLYSKIGNRLGLAQSVKALGDVYWMRNEYSKAEESYIQSHDLFSRIGDQLGFAHSLEGLGRVHSSRQEYAKAGESYLEARRIYHRIGDRYSFADISWQLGLLHGDQAQYEEAERLVREASTIYGELGLKKRVADCDTFIAEIRPLIERGQHRGWKYFSPFLRQAHIVILVPVIAVVLHRILAHTIFR